MKGLQCLFNLSNAQMIVYAYAATKWFLKINDNDFILKKILVIITRLIISTLLALTFYSAMIIFAAYYELIDFTLRMKYGKDYVGILEGTDVLWAIRDQSRFIINSLFLMEAKENENHQHIHSFLTEAYGKLAKTHDKMGCVKGYYMGYHYFLKHPIDISEFVRYTRDYDSLDEFKEVFDSYGNSKLPINDSALWEIIVGTCPIKWQRCTKKLYPIIIRYHHSAGDGIHLVAMNTANLQQNGVEIMKSKCDTYKALLKKHEKKPIGLRDKAKLFLNKSVQLKYSGPLTKKEENYLHGMDLTGDKYLCCGLEEDGGGYVAKVKAIKNRFVGIGFSDVVMAAISASLAEHYMANDQNPPDTIRVAQTFYFSSPDFKKIITVRGGDPVSNLNNNFSIGTLDLPIKDAKLESNVVNRLFSVKKDAEKLKNSIDFAFLYWQLKVVSTLLPMPLLVHSIRTNDNTMGLTNIPGNVTGVLLDGTVIRDTIVFAPNYLKAGLSMSIFTFNDLFRFGFTVDTAVIKNRNEAQKIVDNIFKYIDKLDELTRNF